MPATDPSNPSLLRRWFGRFWWALDASRRVVFNLIFLLLVLVLLFAAFSSSHVKLDSKTALVLNLQGPLVEQRAIGLRERINNQAQGKEVQQTQLRDVLAVLDAAAKDSKIERVVLALDDFSGAGLPALREVAAALERFKASGKQVVAWGTNYDQRRYYLAAHASEVFVHPMGAVLLEGYGRYRNYYKDALDRVGVTANVIRAGAYKNAGEPFFLNAPSKETLESEGLLWNAMWATYTEGVEKARKLPAGAIAKSIEEIAPRFAAAGNNPAKLALNEKLVDGIKTRDELRQLLIERGAKDSDNKSFRQVSFEDYLTTVKPKHGGDAVGVVVAEGEIADGVAPAGRIGGLSTAELIRKAREDDKIKSIVLRVNSPGGSALGSELIRRELELTRAAGKPVVVSMGDLAASGGYWIAMAADEVIADAATITGSIGVFAILPTGEKAMEKLSINTGGVTTTWLGSAYDPRRPLDPRFAQLVQGAITNIYSEFTSKAAAARKTTPEKINDVAQGRVWTGTQAKERGLIDRTGSFSDAIKSAAAKGKLPETASVMYIEPERSRLEKTLERFGVDAAAQIAAQFDLKLVPAAVPASVSDPLLKDLVWLAELSDQAHAGMPFMALTHCLCGK